MSNPKLKTSGRGGYRPGAGRPPSDDKKKSRTFKATDTEWSQIKEKAAQAGLTASEFIRLKSLDQTLPQK